MLRFVRLIVVAAAFAALAASSSSRSQAPPPSIGGGNPQVPAPQSMDPRAALGLWKSSFGAVKIEEESPGRVHGVWMYPRQNQQVIGYFTGTFDGNLLRFTWREPGQAQPGETPLAGEGWLSFDPTGNSFAGRWWTARRDRNGEWKGWRRPPAPQPLDETRAGDPGYPEPPPPSRY